MNITTMPRSEVIERFGQKQGDTGGSEVQVALLSQRIRALTEHLKSHKKDHATRRGLLMLVSRRTKLLRYLANTNAGRYRELIQTLGLRR